MSGKCIVCGREAFVDHLCKSCFLERNPVILEVKQIEINFCRICSRVFINNKWQDFKNHQNRKSSVKTKSNYENSGSLRQTNVNREHDSFNEIIHDKRFSEEVGNVIKKKIVINPIFNLVDFKLISVGFLNENDINNLDLKVKFKISVGYKDKIINDEYEIDINVNKVICPTCNRIKSKYYEGTLQVRIINTESFLNRVNTLNLETCFGVKGSRDFKRNSVDDFKDVNVIEGIKETGHGNKNKEKIQEKALQIIDLIVENSLKGLIIKKKVIKTHRKSSEGYGRKTGFDYYITSKVKEKSFVKKLLRFFDVKIKESTKLISVDKTTSKRISRVVIYVEF